MDLLSKGNTKVLKTNKRQTGYSMKIMHLSPADSSGFGNTCGKESEGCASSCFRNSGHFLHKNVRAAHDYKTEWFFKDNFTFRAALAGECSMHQYDSENVGMTPVVRLNGTSDIAWEEETPDIFEQCKDTQFLDYTKHLSRMIRFLSGELPENYYLTFSRSETTGWSAWTYSISAATSRSCSRSYRRRTARLKSSTVTNTTFGSWTTGPALSDCLPKAKQGKT